MPVKLRVSKQRFAIHPETIAYIRGEPWPEGTPGMSKFWHRWATTSGHRHAKWGYTIEESCTALGIDFEAVKAREVERTRSPAMEAYLKELDVAAGR